MERCLLPFLLVLASTAIAGVAAAITRDDFPPNFIFGAGTSAYQVEGAAAEDGRKPSIWDTYAHSGIEPHVTLHHFDHPQALEDEYGGLVSPNIIEDFTAYADICFKEFGDRVKYWSTFNEPNIEAILGYDVALFPPGRCSSPFGRNCSAGDSRTEPYISGSPMP